MPEPIELPPGESVRTDGAHAQRTEETLEKPAITPAPKPRRRQPPPRRRTTKPTLTSDTTRVAFFVDDQEHIDLARVQDETIERLKVAISTPEARQRLGLADAAGQPTAPRTWGDTTGFLVDTLNALLGQAAVNTWKLTDQQAELLILKRDPHTHQQVVQLTGEILDKYFPGGFGAYDKELTLLILLGGFGLKTVQEIRALQPPAAAGPTLAFTAADGINNAH